MTRLLCMCCLALLVCAPSASGQGNPGQRVQAVRPSQTNESVWVENKRIAFEFDWRDPFERGPATTQVGYYAWRITVDIPQPFTMVFMADTVMRSSSLREIVRASTLRMCPSAAPASLFECTVPIKSHIETDALTFSLIIDDKEFVDRIRRERPMFYMRGRIEPRGRMQLVQRTWQYRDSPSRQD